MLTSMEIIRERISVRRYDGKPLDGVLREKLARSFQENAAGPCGSTVRFGLLDLGKLDGGELRSLGTYGVIKGARTYILSAVKAGERCMIDLGYCLEKVILEATALGLGTCWMAGTFRRSSFARQMGLRPGELLPAITPVGFPVAEMTAAEKMLRHNSRRKSWAELFFNADGKTPLPEEETGNFREALEAVRLAPSASNRQPWRLLRDEAGLFHLYLKENRIYNRILGKVRLQHIDMGIAASHFELAVNQRGAAGRWDFDAPNRMSPGLQYMAAWLPGSAEEQDKIK